MIKELMLTGFQGFSHPTKIRFTEGLNLITGRNNAGKTSILEGIIYGLYGKLPDIHDSLLVSRLGPRTSMTVRLKFRGVDGRLYETEFTGRLRKGGRFRTERVMLLVEGKPLGVSKKEEVRRIISREAMGLGFKRFMNVAYVRQGRLTEILSPKREDMDAVLGINVLRELAKQLDEAGKILSKWEGRDVETLVERLEEEIPVKKENLKLLEEKVERLKREVKELQERIRKAESPELEKLLSLIKRRDDLGNKVKEKETAVKTLLDNVEAKSLEQLRKISAQLEEQVKVLSKSLEDLEDRRDAIREQVSKFKAKAEQLREEAERHRELLKKGIAECPTCGQMIKPDLIKRLSTEKLRRAEELEKEVKPLEEELNELESAITKKEEELRDLDLKRENAVKTIHKVEKHLKEIKKLSQSLENLKLRIKELLASLELELDPSDEDLYAKVESRLVMSPEDLKRAKQELERKKEDLKNSEMNRRRAIEELETLRKKLERLRVRKRALALASQLVNRLENAIEQVREGCLRRVALRAKRLFDSFTDQRVYTKFHIDPDNYRVYVHQRGLSEMIPADRVGGGHQTLISLALRLAILEETGGSRFLILDEPTYGVDSQNLPQLVESIAKVAEKIGQVILVTHHGLGEEYASNVLEVSIGEDGASIVSQRWK